MATASFPCWKCSLEKHWWVIQHWIETLSHGQTIKETSKKKIPGNNLILHQICILKQNRFYGFLLLHLFLHLLTPAIYPLIRSLTHNSSMIVNIQPHLINQLLNSLNILFFYWVIACVDLIHLRHLGTPNYECPDELHLLSQVFLCCTSFNMLTLCFLPLFQLPALVLPTPDLSVFYLADLCPNLDPFAFASSLAMLLLG